MNTAPNNLLTRTGADRGVFSRATSYRLFMLTALIALACQFVAQSYFFPASEVLSDKPLARIDSPFHMYQTSAGAQYCRQGTLAGYEPYFGAGRINPIRYSSSAKLQILAACVTGASAVKVYKATTFLLGVMAPVLLLFACWYCGLNVLASVIATIVAALLWWASPMRWYHTTGMVSYVFVCFYSLAYACLLAKKLHSMSAGWFILLALGGLAGGFIHPHFAICMPPLVLAFLFASGIDRKNIVGLTSRLVLIGLAVGVLSLSWILPSWQYPTFISGDHQYQRLVGWLIPFQEMLGIAPTAKGGSRFFLFLFIGAASALWLARAQHKPLARALLVAGIFFLLFASLGGADPRIAVAQPNRLMIMGWLTLCIPFGIAGASLVTGFSGSNLERLRSMPDRGRRLAAMSTLAITLIIGVSYQVYQLHQEFFGSAQSGRFGVAVPEVKGLGPVTKQLVKLLDVPQQGSDPLTAGRVLFETSGARVHDSSHIAGYLAPRTGREFIGGPYTTASFASPSDGIGFGEILSDIPAARLTELLNLYNISQIVCHSPECAKAFGTLVDRPESDPLRRFTTQSIRAGSVTLTFVQRDASPGYFLIGQGNVLRRSHAGVDIRVLKADARDGVVLKYHWTAGLSTVPPTQLRPYKIDGLPGSFIQLPDPPPEFSIRLD